VVRPNCTNSAHRSWICAKSRQTPPVPGNDRELIGQGGDLWLPGTAIIRTAMHEDEPGALADALVGDLESLRLNYPHRRNLPAQAELHGQVELHRCSTGLVRTGGAMVQSEQVASVRRYSRSPAVGTECWRGPMTRCAR
jgi:hypothetical protein